MTTKKIPIEISARHVHLSKKDFEKLFEKDKQLTPIKKLSQPGEFAAKETLEIANNKEKLHARILGPLREKTQIEISLTDAYKLKLKKMPPIRLSGDLKNTPKITLKNKNKSTTTNGLIIAKRHLHCNKEQAKKLKIKNKQEISVKIPGIREIIFKKIPVRINERYKLALHLDTDEANAAGINKKSYGEII